MYVALISIVLFASPLVFADFSPLVTKTPASAKYCPDSADDQVCLMSQPDAEMYCWEQGMHLPTTYEFAKHSVKNGAIGFLTSGSSAPPGYYKVDCLNPGHILETFFFNHSGYNADTGGLKGEKLWTASVVSYAHQYAHVYYGDWGGGGGKESEHRRDYRHGVRCAPNHP